MTSFMTFTSELEKLEKLMREYEKKVKWNGGSNYIFKVLAKKGYRSYGRKKELQRDQYM